MGQVWLGIPRRQMRIDNIVWLELSFEMPEGFQCVMVSTVDSEMPVYAYPGSSLNNSRVHLSPRP